MDLYHKFQSNRDKMERIWRDEMERNINLHLLKCLQNRKTFEMFIGHKIYISPFLQLIFEKYSLNVFVNMYI
jgi:hypothetical protein